MEEVKILLLALVSFLSNDNLPITARSAEIHIDRANRQVTIKQLDLVSVEQYRDVAKVALDSLMQAQTLREDMAPLRLAHTSFYEEEGTLNAVLYLQYEDIKDLRKMSFYADTEENLSYPYMKDFVYELQTGRIDGRHVRFDQGQDVKFRMEGKQAFPDGIYSLLDDWNAIKAAKYVDVTEDFSVNDFKELRKFILKKGRGMSFRNIENNNPHHTFDDLGLYLASTTVRKLDHSEPLPSQAYNELVIWGNGQFSLYLFDENTPNTNPYLLDDKVYLLKPRHLDIRTLQTYLQQIRKKL
ncbi:hypothetical protein [Maribacter sp. 2307ULW6-5]|uniref:hypothetical protein n=1 Tax=Maribacter sp. 2307ULW6-5 TaxID=3386275 RepID=UPI0039BC32AB